MSDKAYMQRAGEEIKKHLPDGCGFILLVAEHGEGGRLNYTADVDRQDAIKVIKEFLFHVGESENWMKHIK